MITIRWKLIQLFAIALIITTVMFPAVALLSYMPVLAQSPSPKPPPPNPYNGEGLRRGDTCAITPGIAGDTNKIWSDRPLFLWKGDAVILLTLETQDSNYRSISLWNKTLAPGTHSIVYDNSAPLQPGQFYYWKLLTQTDDPAKVTPLSFQVMPAEERAPITAELQALETRLKASGASAEAIALQKADYFNSKLLWSDGLQVLYTLPNPSTAVTQKVQSILEQACPVATRPTQGTGAS